MTVGHEKHSGFCPPSHDLEWWTIITPRVWTKHNETRKKKKKPLNESSNFYARRRLPCRRWRDEESQSEHGASPSTQNVTRMWWPRPSCLQGCLPSGNGSTCEEIYGHEESSVQCPKAQQNGAMISEPCRIDDKLKSNVDLIHWIIRHIW